MPRFGRAARSVALVSASILGLGVIGATGAAATEDSGEVAAAAGGIKVKWDWTMPTFMKDTKTFVPTTDVNDPDYWKGGSYVPGPDGIPDRKMKNARHYKKSGKSVYGKLPANGKFKVNLDASGSSGGTGKLKCTWKINADKTYWKKNKNCNKKVGIKLPEGKHQLWLTVRDRDGHSKTVASHVKVHNALVAIMGDSYASGEGVPPFTDPRFNSDQPKGSYYYTPEDRRLVAWDFGRCNRSRWSGFVRAAQAIESADTRSNVTLIDVACAGAEVRKGTLWGVDAASFKFTSAPTGGILYPQPHLRTIGSQAPPSTTFAPPQVDQVNALTRGADVDTVFLSIGGNDAGLSEVAVGCLDIYLPGLLSPKDPTKQANCYSNRPDQIPDLPQNNDVMWQLTDGNLEFLENSYDLMAPCFTGDGRCRTWKLTGKDTIASKRSRSASMPIGRAKDVVHAMYPDLTTKAENGAIVPCPKDGLVGPSPMTQLDNAWAWDQLYVGKGGNTITLPTQYSKPTGVLPPPDPETITPSGDGLLPLVKRNKRVHGYSAATSLLWESRGHAMCAGDGTGTPSLNGAWEYGMGVAAAPVDNVYNANAVLHPNQYGQQKYADMLAPIGERRTGIPVRKPATHVVSPNGLG